MKRAAIEPFAMSLLNNVDDNVKTNARKLVLDDEVYYKLCGQPTKVHGVIIDSVLFTEDYNSIIVAGHQFYK